MTETWWNSRDYGGWIVDGTLTLNPESRFRLCRENLSIIRSRPLLMDKAKK